MEFVAGSHCHCEGALPHPLSSSSSSSPSPRWAPQQTGTTEGNHPSGGGGSPSAPAVEKEHMFDKVVTPSDVGKLNRLVIPKQHAEKYFPLDASTCEKGLLLGFEDRTGKHWHFRYSYWNSSQSYVMTKGWSRFVKEKRLDAGDIVSFGRGVGDASCHRFFIDWKHRPHPDVLGHPLLPRGLQLPCHAAYQHLHHGPSPVMPFVVPWGHLVIPPAASAMGVYEHLCYGRSSAVSSNPFPYLRSAGKPAQGAVQLGISSRVGGGEDGGASEPPVFNSAAQTNASSAKTVRLFGVNLGSSPSSEGDAAADVCTPPPQVSPLQLRIGESEMAEPPGIDQRGASLDLRM